MRKNLLALLALCCAAGVGPAQDPKAAAPAESDRSGLDTYLTRWEDAMRKIDTLAVARVTSPTRMSVYSCS